MKEHIYSLLLLLLLLFIFFLIHIGFVKQHLEYHVIDL